jgi:four helix bundle protein
MANGSVAELETQILLAKELQLGPQGQAESSLSSVAEVERMLAALIRSLEEKNDQTKSH